MLRTRRVGRHASVLARVRAPLRRTSRGARIRPLSRMPKGYTHFTRQNHRPIKHTQTQTRFKSHFNQCMNRHKKGETPCKFFIPPTNEFTPEVQKMINKKVEEELEEYYKIPNAILSPEAWFDLRKEKREEWEKHFRLQKLLAEAPARLPPHRGSHGLPNPPQPHKVPVSNNINITIPLMLSLVAGLRALKTKKHKPAQTRKLNTILSEISELAQEYKSQQARSAPIARHHRMPYTSKHKRTCVACAAKSR